MVEIFYIGIDVGTSSVRGALVDQNGNVLQTDVKNVSISSPNTDYYEQSSEEIWSSCCQVIKSITKNISIEQVRGIGFDATCSLVVLDADFRPLPVSSNGENGNNIIMWLDHRAGEQAKKINSTKHEVLRYVGGKVSLEMQSPKILWLKQNLPEVWCRAAHFLDLPDFLTWKATGCLSRSICSLTCKWTYVPGAGWSTDFWSRIGLGELAEDNFGKIGESSGLTSVVENIWYVEVAEIVIVGTHVGMH